MSNLAESGPFSWVKGALGAFYFRVSLFFILILLALMAAFLTGMMPDFGARKLYFKLTVADTPIELTLLRELADWRQSQRPLSREALETWKRLPRHNRSLMTEGGSKEFFFQSGNDPSRRVDAKTRQNISGIMMYGDEGSTYLVLEPNAIIEISGNTVEASTEESVIAVQKASKFASSFGSQNNDTLTGVATQVVLHSDDKHPLVFDLAPSYQAVSLTNSKSSNVLGHGRGWFERARSYAVQPGSNGEAWNEEIVGGASSANASWFFETQQVDIGINSKTNQNSLKFPEPIKNELLFAARNSEKSALLWTHAQEGRILSIYLQDFRRKRIFGPYSVGEYLKPTCAKSQHAPLDDFLDDAVFVEETTADGLASTETTVSQEDCETIENINNLAAQFAVSRDGRFIGITNRSEGSVRIFDTANSDKLFRDLNINTEFEDIAVLAANRRDVATAKSLAIGENGKFLAIYLGAIDKNRNGFSPLGMLVVNIDELSDRRILRDELKTSFGFNPPVGEMYFTANNASIVMMQSFSLNGTALYSILEYTIHSSELKTVYIGQDAIYNLQVAGDYIAARIGRRYQVWERAVNTLADRRILLAFTLPENYISAVISESLRKIFVAHSYEATDLEESPNIEDWPARYQIDLFSLNSHLDISTPNDPSVISYQGLRGQHFDVADDSRFAVNLISREEPKDIRTSLSGKYRRSLAFLYVDRVAGNDRIVIPSSSGIQNSSSRRSSWVGIFFKKDSHLAFAIDRSGRRLGSGDPSDDGVDDVDDVDDVAGSLKAPYGSRLQIEDLRRTSDREYLFGQAAYIDEDGKTARCICVWTYDTGEIVTFVKRSSYLRYRSYYDFDVETRSIVYIQGTDTLKILRFTHKGEMQDREIVLSDFEVIEGISAIPGTGKLAIIVSHRIYGGEVILNYVTVDLSPGEEAGVDPNIPLELRHIEDQGLTTKRYSYDRLPLLFDVAWSNSGAHFALTIRDPVSARQSTRIYEIVSRKTSPLKMLSKNAKEHLDFRILRRASLDLTNVNTSVNRHAQFVPSRDSEIVVSADPSSGPYSFVWNAEIVRQDACERLGYLENNGQFYFEDAREMYLDACSNIFLRAWFRLSRLMTQDNNERYFVRPDSEDAQKICPARSDADTCAVLPEEGVK